MEDRCNCCNFDSVLLTMPYAIMTLTTKVMRTQTSTKINVLQPLSLYRSISYDYICGLVNRVQFVIITFCVSHRRRKIYCGHSRVCLSAAIRPHYCTDPDVTWGRGRGRGCPLVVHYWADLQSGHGLRCYGNITRTLVISLHPSRDMTI